VRSPFSQLQPASRFSRSARPLDGGRRASPRGLRAFRATLALGALVLAASSLSACDAAPFAARVNGTVIGQTALNTQLEGWSSNKAWVAEFDSQNQVTNGGSGDTVQGTGGSGTYSTSFSSGVLDGMIATTAIGQHLTQSDKLPGLDIEVASRGVRAAELAGLWTGFPPAVRQYIVDELAYESALIGPQTKTSTLNQAYKTLQPYIFYRLCLQQASAFSKDQAQTLSSTGDFTGTQVCYDQVALESQTPAFYAAVVQLTVGKTTQPIPTKYGYEVAKLMSRAAPTFNDQVTKVVAVAVDATVAQKPVSAVLQSATVKVNPQYGTWSSGNLNPPSVSGQ
jgi:hypothetical protein